MNSLLNALNIVPSDEHLLSDNPKFNGVTEDMELKNRIQKKNEFTEFCVFETTDKLERGVIDLLEAGFEKNQISTYLSHDGNLLDHRGGLKESKIGEGLLLGIALGIVSGGIFGWFSPYEFFTPFSQVVVPKFFNLLLYSVIWGFIGGVLGALVGRSIPEYKEDQYESTLKNGRILILVQAEDSARSEQAKRILLAQGGLSIQPEQLKKSA